MIYLKQGVFSESFNIVNYTENANEGTAKVTLSSAFPTSSLVANGRADGEHQEQRLQMLCLLNRKH